MKQKLLFVINPKAGKGAIQSTVLGCVDRFIQAGFEITIYTTQCEKDAQKIVQTRAGMFDRIVCAGGDGTLNEVVCGLIEGQHDTPLGYIPAGTVNDFASSLGIPKQPIQAAEIAANGMMQCVDIGQFGNRYFCYIAAFGAFTNVSYTTPQNYKNLLGRTAYILEGIKSLPSLKPYTIEVETQDGVVIQDQFIYGMISNATSVGGFKDLTPQDVRMDDGIFELVLIRQPKGALDWQTIFNELIQPKSESRFVLRFKSPCLYVHAQEPISWTLDGEFGGEIQNVKISNLYHALRILSSPQQSSQCE